MYVLYVDKWGTYPPFMEESFRSRYRLLCKVVEFVVGILHPVTEIRYEKPINRKR